MWIPAIEEPTERELDMAQQFLDALAGEWEPARHRDEHRERLLALLESKADVAVPVVEPEAEPATAPVIDLMEALRASVEAAVQARAEGEETG
jgi:DNA end-binding protein Ku